LTSQSEQSGEDEDFLHELLLDDRSKTSVDLVIEADELERISTALDRLGEREAMILRMRFGLDCDPPMTLKEVGKILGLTRARIQQIEVQAIQRLIAELQDPRRDGTKNDSGRL
jgi:RNA polymerase primary sigma factor